MSHSLTVWALGGLAVSFAWMVAFLVVAGRRPIYGLIYVGLVVGAGLAYARVCSETAFDPTTDYLQEVVPMFTGTRWLRRRELVALFTMGWSYTPFPSQTISVSSMNAVTSFKIGDAAGMPLRRLTWLLFASFLVALGGGVAYMLHSRYAIGFNATKAGSANSFPGWYFLAAGEGIMDRLSNLTGPTWDGVVWCATGALVFVSIAVMRLRFLWWPFHPLGYILGLSILADEGRGESPFLIAWIAKSLVLRYGGLRLYQRTLPLAIGLIAGDVLNRSLWNFISLLARGSI
ncbi:MAG: DUF6785 family protein [Armatimonadota bacterium]